MQVLRRVPAADKQCLILEKEPYRYQRVLSDISRNDIRAHGSDPETLVLEVRNWLRTVTDVSLPSGGDLWNRFTIFQRDLPRILQRLRYSERDVQALGPVEYLGFLRDWKAELL